MRPVAAPAADPLIPVQVRAVILVGPPGAGKTTVLERIAGLLADAGVHHAAVEVEALALTHPWPDDDAAFAHLELLAGSFRARGYPLLLAAATVDGPEYLPRLVSAIGAGERLLVRLEAPPAVLRDRIARREPPEWSGLGRLLDTADRLAATHAALPGVDLVLGTQDADPRAVAAAILDALAERRPAREP